MKHLVSLAAALCVSGTLLSATAGQAQAPTGYYVAVPAAPVAKTSLVTRSTAWSRRGGAFVAAQAPERPQILCQLVADRVGGLSSFAVKGQAYDADQLAKCNAHVKPAPAQMVAR
ncbi:hypothetical protein [uncultured Sphingomonas sp.]|uniref:CC_3452 family protein n=1 Tax=uncultured Sphingomonas sp. TaxID=158754 RepID=UPI0035CC5DED